MFVRGNRQHCTLLRTVNFLCWEGNTQEVGAGARRLGLTWVSLGGCVLALTQYRVVELRAFTSTAGRRVQPLS